MASPGILLRFNLTKEDLPLKTKELINLSKSVFDSVGSLKQSEITFENTIKVFTLLNTTRIISNTVLSISKLRIKYKYVSIFNQFYLNTNILL